MKTTLLTLLLCIIFACKDKTVSSKTKVCGVEDPVKNLPWLRDMIEEAKKKDQLQFLTITLGKLKGEPVFDYRMMYMSCIGCVVYRCDGTRVDISKYTQEEMMAFTKSIWGESKDKIILWPEK